MAEETSEESSDIFNVEDDSAQHVFLLMQGLSDHMVLSFQLIAAFCYVLNIYREAIKNSKNPKLEHVKIVCATSKVFAGYGQKRMQRCPDSKKFRYTLFSLI